MPRLTRGSAGFDLLAEPGEDARSLEEMEDRIVGLRSRNTAALQALILWRRSMPTCWSRLFRQRRRGAGQTYGTSSIAAPMKRARCRLQTSSWSSTEILDLGRVYGRLTDRNPDGVPGSERQSTVRLECGGSSGRGDFSCCSSEVRRELAGVASLVSKAALNGCKKAVRTSTQGSARAAWGEAAIAGGEGGAASAETPALASCTRSSTRPIQLPPLRIIGPIGPLCSVRVAQQTVRSSGLAKHPELIRPG